MKKKVSFSVTFHSSKKAKLVMGALSPEIKQKIPKTKVEITLSKNILNLNIESEEVSSLRAACNSYLRWINTAITVNQLV